MERDGVRMTVEMPESAPKAVVVALHGYPGSTLDYRYLAPRLVEEANMGLVRMVIPGFDGTDRIPVTVEEEAEGFHVVDALGDAMARAIESLPAPAGGSGSLLDALAADKIPLIVAGHSFGSTVAATTLKSLVAPGSVPVGGCFLAPIGYRMHRGLRSMPKFMFTVCRRTPKVADAWPMSDVIWKGFKAVGFRKTTAYDCVSAVKYISFFSFDHHKETGRALRAPSAVVYAEDDEFLEPEICAEVADTLPPGVRTVLPSGGHNIQKTQIDAVIRSLSDLVHVLKSPTATRSR